MFWKGNNCQQKKLTVFFSAAKASGKSLYYVDEDKLKDIAPSVIFTQDTCEVCQIDTQCTMEAVSKLSHPPQLVPLSPDSFEDVFDTALKIGSALGNEAAAYRYLAPLRRRIDTVVDTLRKNRAPLKRVMLMEWMSPIYNCGHWIPQQIAFAGGTDLMGNPNGDSIVTPWEKILKYNPEVLVIAPCGFLVHRAVEDMPKLSALPGFDTLAAVQNEQVYFMDFDLFTQPSPSTLVLGVEALAAAFHPGCFQMPEAVENKVANYSKFMKTA